MKKTLLICSVLLLISATAFATSNLEEKTIIVSGSGIVKADPDVAYVNLGVLAEKKSAKEAQASVSKTMNSVLAALKKISIAKDKIKTTRINLSPRYEYNHGKRRFVGFRASNEIKITLDDMAKIGRCIDTAVAAGANDINYISFAIKDQEPFKNTALKTAFANAKTKAETLASAAGVKLGSLITIQESSADVIIPRPRALAKEMSVQGRSSATPVSPGDIEIRGSLTAVFAIR